MVEWRKVEELFRAAADLPADEREAFLERSCGGDAELRREVEQMLAADADSTDFLNAAVRREAAGLGAESADPWIGERIGPYEIFRKLGEGGMGAVYLAGRVDGEYRQQVTIKLLKPGMDGTDGILRRFRNERQILAGLDHPNIARLLDGGSTDDGQPYFVMEYIEGEPVDEYCDRHELSTDERLELFCKICSAVQLAHQNLVVHRDLKPANILVSIGGEPKLLDFGVAKLLNPELAAQTVGPTGIDLARLMTPAYASPEQVRGRTITTATDVYSLGVLLYELLTGRRPYRFESHLPNEIERVICDTEPVKPSLAVGEETAGRSDSRRRDVLRRELSGDLDNIVLMAMRKEPRRRYVSAAQLAEDIRRHRRGQPVIARPDTFGYRSGKFLRRHKLLVAFVASLVIFAIAMTVQSVRVARQRDIARQEHERAEEVSAFLVRLFKLSDRRHTRGSEVTARELLDQGVGEIDVRLHDQPDVLAKLSQTMGMAYLGLGLTEPAGALIDKALELRRGLGRGHELEVAESLHAKGQLAAILGHYEEAEKLLREALEARERLLPEPHVDLARSLNALAEALVGDGRFDEAEPLHRRALAMRRELFGDVHVETLDSVDNLAILLQSKFDYQGAEPLYQESLEIARRLWADDHATVANSMNNLSLFLLAKGDRAGAEKRLRESLAMYRRLLGDEHPELAEVISNRARLLFISGDFEGAEAGFCEALAIFRKGPEDDNLGLTMINLASALRELGGYQEAERLYREALGVFQRTVGLENWQYPHSLMGLSKTLLLGGDVEGAAEAGREALRIFRGGRFADHPYTGYAMTNLASILAETGEIEDAESSAREALDFLGRRLEEGHWRLAVADGILGDCSSRRGDYEDAEPRLLRAYEAVNRVLSPRSSSTRAALQRLVELYDAWGKPDKADEYRTLLGTAT